MKYSRIAITGAGGLLGCRLTEFLTLGEKVAVVPSAHSPGNSARLARLPVKIQWGDIGDIGFVRQLLKGCDAVVHCAYGSSGTLADRRRTNIVGSRNIAQVALEYKLDRVVHISTISVFGFSPPEGTNEDSPFGSDPSTYVKSKIAAEKIMRGYSRKGLPVCILRPGGIYGPYSQPYAVRPVRHLQEGYITIVDDGNFPANLVYIDNVVRAIFVALEKDEAIGQSFFVTEEETTWKGFFGKLSLLTGWPLLSITSEIALNLVKQARKPGLMAFMRELKQLLGSEEFMSFAQQAASTPAMRRLIVTGSGLIPASLIRRSVDWFLLNRRSGGAMQHSPSGIRLEGKVPDAIEVYANKTALKSTKIREMLGYSPSVSFEDAMDLTSAWLKAARIV